MALVDLFAVHEAHALVPVQIVAADGVERGLPVSYLYLFAAGKEPKQYLSATTIAPQVSISFVNSGSSISEPATATLARKGTAAPARGS